MRKLIGVLVLSLFSSVLLAQSDSAEVTQNKSKINELNERLDNLIKTTRETEKDSLEIKIDWLIDEMKTVKAEMSSLKTTVNDLSDDNKKILSEIENNTIDAKDLIEGKYYVVIASRRDQKKAEQLTLELAKSFEVQLVMNSKGTWNHVILKESFPLDAVSKKVYTLRKESAFKDAWWTTSKKLQN